ncbi:chromatin assembly factor 1 subunit A-domain-containing protein [Chytriomyces sp. MP71]|nr:chromatin assembly factor 1 subunit A-domain-containing protein [Chytriomyces sp. MP71]
MHDDKMRIRKERYLNQQQLAAASFIGTSRTVDLTTMDTDTGCAPEMEEPLALEDPYVKYRLCRWKFLKFQEDYRPAYFGTWTKTSSVVGGKNPWAKDVVGGVLNYEVDSEAEWEEDEPGEELQSEDEDDDMGAGKGVEGDGHDGEEMDDWLVPDGYLSEDETDMHEADDSAPKATERSLKEVVKKKVGPLVPVVMAWMADVEQVDPFTYQSELALSNVVNMPYYKSGTNSSKSLAKALKANSEKHSFDESNLEALVQLVDGLSAPIGKLVDMAKERFPAVSKVQLEFKIRQVAVKEKRDGEDKAHWHIKDEFDYLTADEVMGADGSLKRKELAE